MRCDESRWIGENPPSQNLPWLIEHVTQDSHYRFALGLVHFRFWLEILLKRVQDIRGLVLEF